MSHDRDLVSATSENLYSPDERTSFSGVTSTPNHNDRLVRGIDAWLPTSLYGSDDLMGNALDIHPDPYSHGQGQRSSINFLPHLGDCQYTGSQAGSSADTAFGTHGSHDYGQHQSLPCEIREVGSSDVYLLSNTIGARFGTYELSHDQGWSFHGGYTDHEEASSSATAQIGGSDPERMMSFTYSTAPIYDLFSRNDLGIIPMRCQASNLAPDAPPFIRLSSPDLDGNNVSAGIPSRHRTAASVSGSGTLYCHASGCTQSFNGAYARGNLGRHMRLKHSAHHADTREYECEDDACEKSFARPDARLKHYRRDHPHLASKSITRRPYRDWKRKGRSAKVFNDHRDEESGHVSALSTSSSNGLNLNDTHNPQSTISSLARKLTTRFTRKTEESLQCSDCHKTFNRLADLRRHTAALHDPDSPQYACAIPGCERASKPFSRKDKYMDHMKTVHSPSTALAHRQPSGVKYTCPAQGCAREYDQRADLLRHQRIHTDVSERPHKCGQCDKSFLYRKDLKRHEATHLDDKDEKKPSFHCPITSCEYGPGGSGFSRNDGMLRHMKRFHPEWKE